MYSAQMGRNMQKIQDNMNQLNKNLTSVQNGKRLQRNKTEN
ncbi:MAG: hypothetical protein ACLQG5_10095 [Methanobacterium sp.]